MNDIPEIKRCHYCDRIAEFDYKSISVCDDCLTEKAGSEWVLYRTPWGQLMITPQDNPGDLSDWTMLAQGDFKSMWSMALTLDDGDASVTGGRLCPECCGEMEQSILNPAKWTCVDCGRNEYE